MTICLPCALIWLLLAFLAWRWWSKNHGRA